MKQNPTNGYATVRADGQQMADIQNLRLRQSAAVTKPRHKLVQNELKAGTPDLASEPLGPTRIMSPLVRREALAKDYGSKLDLFSDDGGV